MNTHQKHIGFVFLSLLLAAACFLAVSNLSYGAGRVSNESATPKVQRMIAVLSADQSSLNPPLIITQVLADSQRDYLKQVTVKNVSSKEIVRYRLAWQVWDAVPGTEGFDVGPASYGTFLGNPVQVQLRPDEIDTAPAQGVLPMDFGPFLQAKGAGQRIFILVGVTEVRFADGTEWSTTPATINAIKKRAAPNQMSKLQRPNIIIIGCHDRLCWHTEGEDDNCEPQYCYSCIWLTFRQCGSEQCHPCDE